MCTETISLFIKRPAVQPELRATLLLLPAPPSPSSPPLLARGPAPAAAAPSAPLIGEEIGNLN